MRSSRIWFFALGFWLLFGHPQAAISQGAKYNDRGELIWINGLLENSTGCEPPRMFAGTISKVESFPGDNADGYQFILKLPNGKQQKIQASISHDEGALLADFDEMLERNRRVKVKARQCGNGGFWTAEEIRRL